MFYIIIIVVCLFCFHMVLCLRYRVTITGYLYSIGARNMAGGGATNARYLQPLRSAEMKSGGSLTMESSRSHFLNFGIEARKQKDRLACANSTGIFSEIFRYFSQNFSASR